MKMEHVIAAPVAGTLLELTAEVGRQVERGAVLAVVKEDVAASDGAGPDQARVEHVGEEHAGDEREGKEP
jgi:propionyl-CoA carboxylase alpha chain